MSEHSFRGIWDKGPGCIAGSMDGTSWDVPGIPKTSRDIWVLGPGCIAGSMDGTSWDVPGYSRMTRDIYLHMGPGYRARS